MTPEELAELFWDSLERQRVKLNLPVLAMRDPAQPFGSVHPTTHKMWVQAAQDVLDAQRTEELSRWIPEPMHYWLDAFPSTGLACDADSGIRSSNPNSVTCPACLAIIKAMDGKSSTTKTGERQ
jgi:hypothetical protein